MAIYRYRCETDGARDVVRPIGTAEDTLDCPECGAAMPRVFAAPMLNLGSSSARSLLERTERTRERPDVVPAPPPAAGRRSAPATNPGWSRLPRP
ncbi:MAG: zinc ribbon domain-containing protein [Pseudonocardia sp.]|nr:zinc ribbon domain-containing protein [Pseudonocardia sp.]